MSQLMNDLQIVEKIPENLEQRESFINRAIDIRSACMVYLAEYLSHDMVPLEDLGEVAVFQLLTISGGTEEAAVLFEDTLKNAKRSLGEDHPVTLEAMTVVVELYWNDGKQDEAVKLAEEVVKKRKSLKTEDCKTTIIMEYLVNLYWDVGRVDEAMKLLEEVCKLEELWSGEDFYSTLSSKAKLAAIYLRQGRLVDGTELLQLVKQGYKREWLGKTEERKSDWTLRTLSSVYHTLDYETDLIVRGGKLSELEESLEEQFDWEDIDVTQYQDCESSG